MAERKPTKKATQKSSSSNETSKGFSAEERAAMRERAKELKAEARADRDRAAGEKRPAREDRRDAGAGSRHGHAAPCDRHGHRAGSLAENLVRDARVRQGRQDRLLLPERREVQVEVRDARLQRPGRPSTKAPCGRLPSR